MLFLSIHPSYGQFFRRRKQSISQKTEIDTPRKRKKLRTSSASETNVKVKKTRKFISKKSKNNESRVKVSQKSNDVAAPIDDRLSLRGKKNKPAKEFRKSKKHSEKLSKSDGSVKTSIFGKRRKSNTDEKITQRVRTKRPKKGKKERENTEEKFAGSNGPITIGKEGYRKEVGTIYKDDKKGGSKYKPYTTNEKVTQKIRIRNYGSIIKENRRLVNESDGPGMVNMEPYRKKPGTIYRDDKKGGSKYKPYTSNAKVTQRVKMKSQKRQKKDREQIEEKRADSNGPIGIKREAYRKEPGTIYREDKKGGSKYKPYTTNEKVTQKIRIRNYGAIIRENRRLVAESDGPVIIDMEPYRKRPGTIYREDKKGGSRYKSKAIKGAYTMKGRTPDKKDKIIAKKTHKAATYEGDFALLKNNKELHPSASYLEGKKQKSIEEKEKLRKKEVRKSRGRNSGQPKAVTRKKKKPKYDSRESEIWYE